MNGDLSKKVKSGVKSLIDDVKKLCESQKEIWQQVPYWALQADGRGGFYDGHATAYNFGHWLIQASVNNGYFTACVDLETGKLINPFKPEKDPRDDSILMIALDLEQIDAKKILDDLKKEARGKDGSLFKNAEETKIWREQIIKENKLDPNSYKRTKALPPVNWSPM